MKYYYANITARASPFDASLRRRALRGPLSRRFAWSPANLAKCATVILLLCLACTRGAEIPVSVQAVARTMPDRETQILCGVAEEYDLNASELKLLLTIRRIENGRPGLELGIGSDYRNHPARRFSDDPDRSLQVQGRWAAGTIRLRYTGDIDAFARKYCPPEWQHWAGMARYWMSQ